MLIRFFVTGVTWSVRASSGKLCCVTSPGKLSSALQSLSSLLRDVTLWHGLGLLQMVGFKASVQRTGARWRAQLRKQEALVSRGSRESRDSRERARTLARHFKLSGFGHRPQAAGPIRASVRGGAPPARLLLQGTFM